MTSDRFVALNEKIKILCDVSGISPERFQNEMKEKYGIRYTTTDNWLSETPQGLYGKTREKFESYWKDKNITFSRDYFSMPLKDFAEIYYTRSHLDASFCGTYQIVRPHQSDPGLYILEAMEIKNENHKIFNFMYSHNFRDKDDLYKGEAYTAERYYFSLLSRRHENGAGKSAFRCITFYIGDGANRKFLSGIMIRGVEAKGSDAGTQAAGLPFVAIHCNEQRNLEGSNPTSLCPEDSLDELYRVHDHGHILLGEVGSHNFKILFDICEKIFREESIFGNIFNGNDLVIHTISPSFVKRTAISFSEWKACVDNYIQKNGNILEITENT